MQKTAIVLLSLIGACISSEWSYEDESQWGGVCGSGTQQSPIDIVTVTAQVDIEAASIQGPLVFQGYEDVKVTAENNGHTLQWNRHPSGPGPTISGGPLRGEYTLMQFHLHWQSEHAIDGLKYPLEIHLVHVKSGLTIDEAVQSPDGLAVVGVLAQVSNEESSTLEEIMAVVPELAEKHSSITDYKDINLSRLLSPSPQSYYTYPGSLTTPSCQEAVTWIVMDKPLTISNDQYNQIITVDVGGSNNYRSLQPVQSRVVYRSMAS